LRSSTLLVYGAYGFTGALVVAELVKLGVKPVLAGRDAAKLGALADATGLDCRPGALSDLPRLLTGVGALLLAAGPFTEVVGAAVEACLTSRTHYLDLTGEYQSIERVRARDRAARERGIMLMPAVGLDVVASDCLLAHVAARLPGARELVLAISGLELMSRGSARTLVEQLGRPAAVRRGGRIELVPVGSLRGSFDFGAGPAPSTVASWGDVATAQVTTGVPDLTVYFESPPLLEWISAWGRYAAPALQREPVQWWLRTHALLLPEGPDAATRASRSIRFFARAAGRGAEASARLSTPEAYTFSSRSAAAVARRVLEGDLEPGFQTPGRVYGPNFVLSLAGVEREDLDSTRDRAALSSEHPR
jgi:short subunit dehydrogenase-like uncharacterized protein